MKINGKKITGEIKVKINTKDSYRAIKHSVYCVEDTTQESIDVLVNELKEMVEHAMVTGDVLHLGENLLIRGSSIEWAKVAYEEWDYTDDEEEEDEGDEDPD